MLDNINNVIEAPPIVVIAKTLHPKWPIAITNGCSVNDLFLTIDEARQLSIDLMIAVEENLERMKNE